MRDGRGGALVTVGFGRGLLRFLVRRTAVSLLGRHRVLTAMVTLCATPCLDRGKMSLKPIRSPCFGIPTNSEPGDESLNEGTAVISEPEKVYQAALRILFLVWRG